MARKFIYDTQTKNISFIQTAVDLQKLGIKNNKFFLKLYNRDLQGIDPHDPNLPQEYIPAIITECVINPWYFLRECARIPDQGNPKGIPYLLNRANLASTWCFINGIDNYLTISRQIGKTQSIISIIDWGFLFGTTNSEFSFMNMQYEKAVENLERLKMQRDLLPPYMQFKIAFDDDDNIITATDNVKTLKNANNNNKIVTKPSATSIERAERIGRGSTQPIQYYDEFDFIDYIKTIMEASGPAFVTAAKNAKKNNSLYGRIITSTPGDLDSRAGQEAMQIIENTCRWTESFYDLAAEKGIDAVKESISLESSNGIVYIEYQYNQLGKDDEYFREMCRVLNNNPLKIKREIFLMRLHGSSNSPYSPEDLEAIAEKEGTIIDTLFINIYFKFEIYTKLDRDKIYFVGVDVANGYNSDNSAITIWDPYTLKTVAEFKSSYIGVKDLIKVIYVLIRKYIPKSILIVERNANGEAVLDHLRATDIAYSIYYDSSKDLVGSGIDDKLSAEGLLIQQAARRRLYGVYTQGKSREIMFSLLEAHINEHKDGFVGKNIINDIMKLVSIRGKIQAGPGAHDDSIMSFLMCLYVYYHGNNLHRYGFYRGSLPTEEERNKGLSYDDYMNLMSDADKEFFKDSGFSEYETVNDYDIAKQIEQRGLIGEDELHKAAGIEKPHMVDMYSKMTPYERKIHNEMVQAEALSKAFDQAHGITKNYEMIDDIEANMGMDLSLFDELND
jgi:hypothetical protein